MLSMRAVLNSDVRRLIPWTSYPLASRNAARYAPSCPVTPVISAFFKLQSPWMFARNERSHRQPARHANASACAISRCSLPLLDYVTSAVAIEWKVTGKSIQDEGLPGSLLWIWRNSDAMAGRPASSDHSRIAGGPFACPCAPPHTHARHAPGAGATPDPRPEATLRHAARRRPRPEQRGRGLPPPWRSGCLREP